MNPRKKEKVVIAVATAAPSMYIQRTDLEVLLAIVKAELVTLELEDLAELGRTAEENGNTTFPLLAHLNTDVLEY